MRQAAPTSLHYALTAFAILEGITVVLMTWVVAVLLRYAFNVAIPLKHEQLMALEGLYYGSIYLVSASFTTIVAVALVITAISAFCLSAILSFAPRMANEMVKCTRVAILDTIFDDASRMTVEVAEVNDVLQNEIMIIRNYWSVTHYNRVSAQTSLWTGILVSFVFAWEYTLFLFACLVLSVVTKVLGERFFCNPLRMKINENDIRANHVLGDITSLRQVIRMHNNQEEEAGNLLRLQEESQEALQDLGVRLLVINFLRNFVVGTALPFVVIIFVEVYGSQNPVHITHLYGLFTMLLFARQIYVSFINLNFHDAARLAYDQSLVRISNVSGRCRLEDMGLFSLPVQLDNLKIDSAMSTHKAGHADSHDVRVPNLSKSTPDGDMKQASHHNDTRIDMTQTSSDALTTSRAKKPLVRRNETTPAAIPTVEGIPFEIEVVDATLGYHDKETGEDKIVFADFSFKLGNEEKMCLISETGMGKTTIFNTLAGLIPLVAGKLRLQGEDIDAHNIRWLRDEVSVVTQESPMFCRTIRENIVYGLPRTARSPTASDMADAVSKACMTDWLVTLPQGLDTPLRSGGDELSGGQKQRIQLARLFLRGALCSIKGEPPSPRIVLLDEPTSALDPITQTKIMEHLKYFLAKRSAMIITHRMELLELATSVKKLDRISLKERVHVVDMTNEMLPKAIVPKRSIARVHPWSQHTFWERD